MSDPSRVRVTGPLTPYVDGFAAELSRQGYRPNARASQLQLMAHASAGGFPYQERRLFQIETLEANRR